MKMTDEQDKAIASLRRALTKCKKAGLSIIGADSDLAIFSAARHIELLKKYDGDQYKAISHHLNEDDCPTISGSAFIDSMGL